MCWGIPAKIIEIKDNKGLIEISGVRKNVVLDLISNPLPGEYVLVHAGYAIQKVREEDADFTVNFFKGKIDNA
ncbi:MAG: HypC/HybG/HupF family hydrogenase formation chaperone [Candidatus Omnitrophota bacterium]